MTTEHQTEVPEQSEPGAEEEAPLQSRREFLLSLGKWSKAVIAGAVLGGALTQSQDAQAGWLNGRGGGWINRRGYGGGGWINGHGGGGGWINRRGGWYNRY